jgi:N-acetylmuramoyl-L-alanine amidase
VAVREYEELLRGDFFGAKGSSPRVVIATLRNQSPHLVHIAQQISRHLHSQSDQVIIIDHADITTHIRTANTFEAHVYVGIDYVANGEDFVAYYETPNFVSQGGRSLARRVAQELGMSDGRSVQINGMRLPVLRETRMPAIICSLGNLAMLIEHQKIYAQALATAISVWVSGMKGGSSESPSIASS